MSSDIWTPDALSSEQHTYKGLVWRLVEAQHSVSTLTLVDTLSEQKLLEELIEETKPAVPVKCRSLDFLLSTPFRYGAAYPHGSRFRKAGMSLGVFYASEYVRTALSEMVFYRVLFFSESPLTPWPKKPMEFTAFSVSVSTVKAIDLTKPPLSEAAHLWTHPDRYGPCQELADHAREAGIDLIRYQSVRDPDGGRNIAILECDVFAKPAPIDRQTWHLRFSSYGVQAICEFPRDSIEYPKENFRKDKRTKKLDWDR